MFSCCGFLSTFLFLSHSMFKVLHQFPWRSRILYVRAVSGKWLLVHLKPENSTLNPLFRHWGSQRHPLDTLFNTDCNIDNRYFKKSLKLFNCCECLTYFLFCREQIVYFIAGKALCVFIVSQSKTVHVCVCAQCICSFCFFINQSNVLSVWVTRLSAPTTSF